jgi:tRNA(Leu) C34 or U34 (ribose-2'-O)-methylase TrmL
LHEYRFSRKNFSSGQTLQIVQGDITIEEVDAIVNAANEDLQHGGGVAWAISKKAERRSRKESDAWIRKYMDLSHTRILPGPRAGLPPACEFIDPRCGSKRGCGANCPRLDGTRQGTPRSGRVRGGRRAAGGGGGQRRVEIPICFVQRRAERARKHLLNRLKVRIEADEVSGDLFQKLSDTETPQGILAVLEFTDLPIPDSPNFILIPDQVRDPGNLGTLLRTAAATGVQAVILPPETTEAFAPKVLRAGMGAHFRVPVHSLTWEEIGQMSKSANLQIYIADMDGASCWETDLCKPLALVIGGEAEGASDEARKLAQWEDFHPHVGTGRIAECGRGRVRVDV